MAAGMTGTELELSPDLERQLKLLSGPAICPQEDQCRKTYVRVTRTLRKRFRRGDHSLIPAWQRIDGRRQGAVISGILFFQEKGPGCQHCFYCFEVYHIGMTLRDEMGSRVREGVCSFEAFGLPAFALMKKLLWSVKLLPRQKTYRTFCLKAARERANSKLGQNSPMVPLWKIISEGCECALAYEKLAEYTPYSEKARQKAGVLYGEGSGLGGDNKEN